MSHHDLAAHLLSAARVYVESTFGVPLPDADSSTLRHAVEQTHPGGWSGFAADATRAFRASIQASASEVMSPIKRKARVETLTGKRLREYDEVVSFTETSTGAAIVVSYATVDYMARRDVVKSRRVVLYSLTRDDTDQPWSRRTVEVTTEVDETFVRFGAVMTPERLEAIMEAYETCYRPGTESAPMSGWVARAGISHKQAHPELYPARHADSDLDS